MDIIELLSNVFGVYGHEEYGLCGFKCHKIVLEVKI